MDQSTKNRIALAWEKCKDWITEFDGAPTITLLGDVPPDSVLPAVQQIEQQSENLRITVIPTGKPDSPQFVPLASLSAHLAGLQAGEFEEVSLNYAVRFEEFDLDIHAVIFPPENHKLILEFVWWSDQVFSEETNDFLQFEALMSYFIQLQNLFSSPQLIITAEEDVQDLSAHESWVVV